MRFIAGTARYRRAQKRLEALKKNDTVVAVGLRVGLSKSHPVLAGLYVLNSGRGAISEKLMEDIETCLDIAEMLE